MSGVVYACGSERRRVAVATTSAPITGIDYVEVGIGPPLQLVVNLVKPIALPAGAVSDAIIALSGGERLPPPHGTVSRDPTSGDCARIVVTFAADAETDFSIYRLTLVRGPDDPRPPPWIDPRLASVGFSFKADCPQDFDCAPDCAPAPDPPTGPPLDYTARDYDQLRQLVLDRMTTLVPGFSGSRAADFTTTLAEALAYDADQASYRLDWVGTEAFLGTARSRTSLRRHARLVDYAIGEGASARTFVSAQLTPGIGAAADGMTLAAGTPLLPRDATLPIVLGPVAYRRLLAGTPLVFETLTDVRLWQWRNEVAFYTWGDDRCTLCAGATSATLVDGSNGPDALVPGDLLLLEETRSSETGLTADARRDHRQVVRLTRIETVVDDVLKPPLKLVEVGWDVIDALRFDLAVQVVAPGDSAAAAGRAGAVARANVVIAEHGVALPPVLALGMTADEMAALRPRLDPPSPDEELWAPRIVLPGALMLPPARSAPPPPAIAPASGLLAVDPASVLPVIALDDEREGWTARADLLASGSFGRDFVVEIAIDGVPTLRFGDNSDGLAPLPGAAYAVHGRFGLGIAGNLGADSLAHVVLPDAQATALVKVTNPVPASGGAEPESAASIRARAPEAFRRQDRAVTAADYVMIAKSLHDVSDALAVARWTGAWWTWLVYVDRAGDRPLDAAFTAGVASALDRYRMMGCDVALAPAQPAPLDIELEICAAKDEIGALVGARIRKALSPSLGGAAAFFHPDRFGFSTTLQLSRLIAAVMAVPGVSAARATRFQRWARAAQGELAAGVIIPNGPEILKLADDASRPELGRLVVRMVGGR